MLDFPPQIESGWDESGSIVWAEEHFPSEITDILLDPNYNGVEMEYAEDELSDDDVDSF